MAKQSDHDILVRLDENVKYLLQCYSPIEGRLVTDEIHINTLDVRQRIVIGVLGTLGVSTIAGIGYLIQTVLTMSRALAAKGL